MHEEQKVKNSGWGRRGILQKKRCTRNLSVSGLSLRSEAALHVDIEDNLVSCRLVGANEQNAQNHISKGEGKFRFFEFPDFSWQPGIQTDKPPMHRDKIPGISLLIRSTS